MKTLIGRFVMFAMAGLTIGVFAGHAQIVNQLDFKMTHSFTAGNTTFGPGSYTIRPVQGTDQAVIEISAVSGKPSAMVEVNSAQPDASQSGTQLIFNKYSHVLSLSKVFPGGGNSGYELVAGHPEKLAAKTEKPTKQTVTGTAK
jgi:hypothetical protein